MAQLIINGIIAGSIYTLIAIGFGLIYSVTRFFHFAHGAVYTAGAYFAYLLVVWYGLPLFLAVSLAVILSSLLGVLIEITIYRSLRKKGSDSLIFLLTSLGIYIVLQNVISLVFGDDTKSLRSGEVLEGIKILGGRITPVQISIIVVSIILFIITSLILKKTKIGKAIRAVANDLELAEISGIDTDKIILYTFAVGSALAASAAILISFDIDMTPNMGLSALMMGIVAVIIGGKESIHGVACGGLFLGLAQHIGSYKISSKWQDSIAFFILILFLLFRPQGFVGKKIKNISI